MSVLALGRDLAILGALITAALVWADLAARGVGFWTGAAVLAGEARAPAYVTVVADLLQWLGLYLPPLGGLAASLLALPVWLLVAVGILLLWMALFDLWYTWWWNRWDQVRRAVSLARGATGSVSGVRWWCGAFPLS